MVRTERESREAEQGRQMAGLLVRPRPVESLENGAGISGKT